MQIFIQTLNKTQYSLDVTPDDTVGSIKLRLFDKEKIPIESQVLMFSGKVLEDGATLRSYEIARESSIHLAQKVVNNSGTSSSVPSRSPLGSAAAGDRPISAPTAAARPGSSTTTTTTSTTANRPSSAPAPGQQQQQQQRQQQGQKKGWKCLVL
eukprot:gnl/Hemi2/9206_TR3202_c0_g1_i1.p1 gnl/Hemi2/9206_TR3202_c0_g1~~gnl/Hemi2/9206_TR3202_c0_g1_i1.p1  ORF type:complete len:154 (+),score=43.97 gnl/Hemi2/9206_TR3202_c0_g1_i1:113-574(+)